MLAKKRPKYLNLIQIRLPPAGIASIMHRISGAGLFLILPLLIYLLQLSLGTPQDFATFKAAADHPLVKLFLIVVLWGFVHHFFMGIRILLIDIHIGVDLPAARASAVLVTAVGVLLTAILGVKLW